VTYTWEFKRDTNAATGSAANGTVYMIAAGTSARQYIAEEII
jgi:hypothetical protein